jgi:ABC-type transport system involved in multi-copper enzyme maturation permease subunit
MLRNPVLVKEMRGRMRGNRAMLLLTIYLSIIAVVTLLVYLAMASTMSFGVSDLEVGRRIGKTIFLTVMTVALAQVCIITPALTSPSIAGERERQSFDLLVTTLLSPWQIVLGKLMAALAFALLLIVSVLPMAGLSFLFGGVSGIELLIGIVGLVVSAILFASLGMFWSALMRGTQGATVLAQSSVLLWLIGIPFVIFILGTLVFEFMNDLLETPLGFYLAGILLCAHPFIALGITEGQISQGENPFFFTIDLAVGTEVLAPSPWLGYSFMALLGSVVLLTVSVRMMTNRQRRERAPRPPRKSRPTPDTPAPERPDTPEPG